MREIIKHSAIAFAVLIAIWQLGIVLGGVNTNLFPAPLQVLDALNELWSRGLLGGSSDLTLPGHIAVSLGRFLVGYLLAAAAGIGLGLLLGYFPKAFAYVNPVIQLIRPIAPVAWMPFIVLWFGIGNIPAIVIIFIAGFFPVLLATAGAVGTIDPVYWKVADNFGMTGSQKIAKIVFPSIFPQIAASLKLAIGTSWIFLVSGEMVGAQSGLGFLIMDAKNSLRPDSLLAVMIVIGIIGLILDKLIGLLEKKVRTRWGVGNV